MESRNLDDIKRAIHDEHQRLNSVQHYLTEEGQGRQNAMSDLILAFVLCSNLAELIQNCESRWKAMQNDHAEKSDSFYQGYEQGLRAVKKACERAIKSKNMVIE